MASNLVIKRRIKSVSNVKQITKAMELTSAAKMNRAQSAVLGTRPYATRMLELVRSVQKNTRITHPLLEVRPVTRELIIVVTSDSGLAGALNTQIIKTLLEHRKQNSEAADIVMVGKKGQSLVAKYKLPIYASFTDIPASPSPEYTRPISLLVSNDFLQKKYDKVTVIYNHFYSTLNQKPVVTQLLPFALPNQEQSDIHVSSDMTFEPNKQAILDTLLPRLVDQLLFQLLLEATASEHAARMVAMRTASDNANDLLDDLRLTFNSIRQSSITAQLAEISASMSALE